MPDVDRRKHRYAPMYRPPGITLPKGWELVERPSMHEAGFDRRTDLPVSRHPFGVIEYDRSLSDEEVSQYQLEVIQT